MPARVFIILLGFSCFFKPAQAEADPWPAEYNVRLWQMEDGLPHNIVQAITQTQDGYLWVGTREGLARFDGTQFRNVNLFSGRPQPSVSCLLAGQDGVLWIGTETRGLFRLEENKLEQCETADGARDFEVAEMAEGADKVVWIASPSGLFRWSNDLLERQPDFRSKLKSLCVDTNGAVWEIGMGQLTRLGETPGNHYAISPGSLPGWVRCIYCDRNGFFWIAAGNDAGNGLIRLRDGVATAYHKANGPSGIISAMLEDSAGRFWIGSRAGLSWFENGIFVDRTGTDDSTYQIHAIFEDREKNIWVGSEEGLSRLTPRIFKTITKKDGLALNMVVSVCAGRDNSVWISSWGGGLNHWVDGGIKVLNKAGGLSSDFIMAMTEGHDGSLWAGGDYGAALNRIKDGEITQYGAKEGFVPMAGSATSALCESSDGTLWIGDMEGLQHWNGKRFIRLTDENSPGQVSINALCSGDGNILWIGTDQGLMRMNDGQFENLTTNDARLRLPVFSLYEDADHTLWIGSKGGGLLRWKDRLLNEFTSEQGLSSDSIYSILEDDHNKLWLNGSRGIFSLEKKQMEAVLSGRESTLKPVAYGRADGIASSGQYRYVIQPSACKSADGRLWFRTTQGVAVVNPDEIKLNNLPPQVVIQEVIADKTPTEAGGAGLTISPRVVIAPGRGELEIHYAALSYRAPEKNRYRYQLEGVDMNWVEAGTRQTAFYNNLPPGRYCFRVTACNNDGIWSSTGAQVLLQLEPHYWQTGWFRVLVGLAAVTMVGGSARYFTRRRMQRKLELLKQQHAVEKERARIARDMHDELGAKLTRISFEGATASRRLSNPVEAGQHISRMSATARELVLSLDQIVWAVDPENDSLESLANYICRYAGEFVDKSPLTCEFVIPPELPDCRLSTDVRHHVFLAVKEALNNVLKHSGATRVVLTMAAPANEFEVRISDDGCGMTLDQGEKSDRNRRTGHGLKNLHERLAAIRGRCEVSSAPGSGTEIRLVIPLPAAGNRVSSIHPTRTSIL